MRGISTPRYSVESELKKLNSEYSYNYIWLTPQSVLYILQKRGQKAGVANFSAHDFRRTFISELLDSGADISTVQSLAGHASPELTARYDRRNEETKRRAVQALIIPGSRKRK